MIYNLLNPYDDHVIQDISYLMREHFNEVNPNDNIYDLNIDWETYRYLYDLKKLIALGAYKDGSLVGYSVVILSDPPHYKGKLTASSDAIFVKKEFRNSSIGLKLIHETEKVAKYVGCKQIHWSTKVGSNLAKLFERKSKEYRARDIIFSKEL